MVQVVPRKTNLGTQLGEAIGSGFEKGSEIGLARYFDQLQQQQSSELQNQQRVTSATNLADQLFGKEPSEQKSSLISTLSAMDPKDQIKGIGQLAEAEILNQYLRQASPQMTAGQEPAEQRGGPSPQQQIPAIGKLAPLAQQQMAQKKMNQQKEMQFFKINEPKLIELSDKLQNYELEDARYSRLSELFDKEGNKMPSNLTAALFSSGGQINPKAAAFLSAPAQEAVKLITDLTSGIKDTYGARVTNFDLETYLKKLPSLLNSPDGRKRVLRDLQMINKLNRMHAEGVLGAFEENGGPGAIPYSKAESIFRDKNKDKISELKKEFITGKKPIMKELPSASDPQNRGRKIRDTVTGEILESDGENWVPVGK